MKQVNLVYGVGYIGFGDYKPTINGKHTKLYKTWSGMLERCYSSRYKEKFQTYLNCVVIEQWYNFQTFATWMDKNHVKEFELDKDILVKGNKIYSPETCCFVPKPINYLFTKRQNERGLYPIGVSKTWNKFKATVSKIGKVIYLGTFDTPEEAFQAYKIAKEAYIKEVADKWRGQITEQVYKALINYKIEITD